MVLIKIGSQEQPASKRVVDLVPSEQICDLKKIAKETHPQVAIIGSDMPFLDLWKYLD
jgi:hypothetical protein